MKTINARVTQGRDGERQQRSESACTGLAMREREGEKEEGRDEGKWKKYKTTGLVGW